MHLKSSIVPSRFRRTVLENLHGRFLLNLNRCSNAPLHQSSALWLGWSVSRITGAIVHRQTRVSLEPGAKRIFPTLSRVCSGSRTRTWQIANHKRRRGGVGTLLLSWDMNASCKYNVGRPRAKLLNPAQEQLSELKHGLKILKNRFRGRLKSITGPPTATSMHVHEASVYGRSQENGVEKHRGWSRAPCLSTRHDVE